MKLTKRALDRLDLTIERIYREHCCGVQINMLDIGQVFRAARNAAAPHLTAAKNIEDAVNAAAPDMTTAILDTVARIRRN